LREFARSLNDAFIKGYFEECVLFKPVIKKDLQTKTFILLFAGFSRYNKTWLISQNNS